MRDIKFRQWDKTSAEFFYWGFGVGDFIFASPALLSDSNPIKDSEQFTGLQDKNGKDIYEGDVISVFYKDNKSDPENYESLEAYIKDNSIIWTVEFGEGKFLVVNGGWPERCHVNDLWNRVGDSTTVIGNIHENEATK